MIAVPWLPMIQIAKGHDAALPSERPSSCDAHSYDQDIRHRHFALLFALIAGCSSSSESTTPANDSGLPGADGGLPDAELPASSCPSSQPSATDSCSGDVTCEYGTSRDYYCNTVATCVSNQWKIQPPTCMNEDAGASCPATYASVPRGAACSPTNAECDYSEGRCVCSTQRSGPIEVGPDGGEPVTWYCEEPASGCPTPRPNIGTACTTPSQICDYGSCTLPGGIELECTDGAWVMLETGCPA